MNALTERKIFQVLVNAFERTLLDQLSTESGLSKSGVIRTLILKEVAMRQLVHTKLGQELKT